MGGGASLPLGTADSVAHATHFDAAHARFVELARRMFPDDAELRGVR